MRQRYCRICKGWHPTDEWPRECIEHYEAYLGKKRSDIGFPAVRRDHMDDLWHPLDGNTYTSRSDYDAVTKGRPDVVEIGNERQHITVPVDDTVKDDVLEAMSMVNQGYKPNLSEAKLSGEGWVD